MTKEELEKEAEVFVSEKTDKGNFDVEKFGRAYFSESSMKQALVKFAEPREKRIAELKAQIEKMINEIDKTMVLSNMCECEICDIQDIFRKNGFKWNEEKWEIKEK
ncbi:MAG: hypothetical protein J6S67_07330 [Methanobrevibacter sp.]|nr:hypothetical protein [Methanobrevibacter sp.]